MANINTNVEGQKKGFLAKAKTWLGKEIKTVKIGSKEVKITNGAAVGVAGGALAIGGLYVAAAAKKKKYSK